MREAVVSLQRMNLTTTTTLKCSTVACKYPADKEFVTCKVCALSFHARCGGVRKTGLAAMRENTNIVWYCIHCSQFSINDTATSLMNCTKAVIEMVSKLDVFTQNRQPSAAAESSSPVSLTPDSLTPASLMAAPTNRPYKRTHDLIADDSPEQPKKVNKTMKTTPSTSAMTFGTKSTSSDLVAAPPKGSRTSTNSDDTSIPFKHIYVTRLLPSTSEEDVVKHVMNNSQLVNADLLKCCKLVPKSRNIEDLSFVSFKLSTSEADFSTLISPDVWPLNVAVREFQSIEKRPSITSFRRRHVRPTQQ